MFSIPDPTRLLPPGLLSRQVRTSMSLLEGVLMLGGFCLTLAVVIGTASAAWDASPWLAFPVGLAAYAVMIGVWEASPALMGFVQAVFYAGVSFIFADGLDRADPLPAWLAAGVVLALLLWATYALWRSQRRPG